MNTADLMFFSLFLLIVTLLVKPLGQYLYRVFHRQPTRLDPILLPLEKWLARMDRIDMDSEMPWQQYACAMLLFGLLSTLWIILLLQLQPLAQPPDPRYHPGSLSFLLSLNTAISFATSTTWQAYSGEAQLSYLSQTLALTAQNFIAGGTGLAVGIAFLRGFSHRHQETIGNFWSDLTRAVLWVLLPGAIIGALLLIMLGVPQNWQPYQLVQTLQGAPQILAQGPVATLEIIKNLGTNGGGYFAANGAHPYANPNAMSNMLGMLAIVLIPAALTWTFGRMAGRQRHGWLLYGVMVALFATGLILHDKVEQQGNPRLAGLGVSQQQTVWQSGGNMEGKEVRFGIGSTTLATIAASNGATGSTNAAIDSNMPLGGGIALANLLLGEVAFGGLGTGLYSLILVAMVAVFLCGLMIGRTPNYLGKSLGPAELKLVALYTLIAPVTILLLSALAVSTSAGLAALATNGGAHGLSGILVAYATCFANNGMSFGGMAVDTPFYHLTTSLAMLLGRYGLALPVLALAARLGGQGQRDATASGLPTEGLLFGFVLVATLILIGGLSFLPAWVMGPLAEHLQAYPAG